MDYNLKGGVLIIGSLFWQDDRDSKGDGIRKRWRDSRLEMSKSIKASVPIRYGRFSGSEQKGNETYTMVYDKNLSKDMFGRGKVLPFKNNVGNWHDLRVEVEGLSEAEGPAKRFVKGDDAWCVCCILFNEKVSQDVRADILSKWGLALNENKIGSSCFLQDAAAYSCTTQGELEIPWPVELKALDFLIATSTQPRNREGIKDLTITEITDHISNREYFIPNFLRGIGTNQDREILTAINSNQQLTQSLFKSVIERYEDKKDEDRSHRYWSWDHCYQAFHSKLDDDTKALHLANYLASWGMNRGSGGLLQKDYRVHLKAIEILSNAKYSAIDCCEPNDISGDKIKLLLEIQSELSKHYSSIGFERMGDQLSISATDILISKILLGTLSCTPAYDEFLKLGLKVSSLKNRGFSKKGFESLLSWVSRVEIQKLRNDLPEKARNLPLMKLVDVYFWSLGYSLSIIEK